MNPLFTALARIARDLDHLGSEWALVGGLAVSIRAEPRTTRDVDLVVVVENDREAEELIQKLFAKGYRQHSVLEADPPGRLKGMRLLFPGSATPEGVIVDLLFSVSEIEREIAAWATLLEAAPRFFVPVASTGHLLALKLLAWRSQDQRDARWLVAKASAADLEQARTAIELMDRRGRGDHRELARRLQEVLDNPEAGA